MKLRDIKIGTQLRLGLGLIMLFVLFLGGLALRQANLLWQQTQTMYQHPLLVRRAVGYLETDSQALSRYVRDMFLTQSADDAAAAMQNIEFYNKDTENQLDILIDLYLGPRSDITTLQNLFLSWDIYRQESIRLFHAGQAAEALARHQPGGEGDVLAEAVRKQLAIIDDFAENKSIQLYQDAEALKNTLIIQMAAISVLILLLSLGIYYVLMRGIDAPLQQLTWAANQIQSGQLDVRSRYQAANEFGELSTAFDALADVTQANLRLKGKSALLNASLARINEARAFCKKLLEVLVAETNSQIGAVYLLNDQQDKFEHFESLGLDAGKRSSFSAVTNEGEFGLALATKEIQRISDIPENTHFTFAAVGGEFKPQEIITIPLSMDGDVKAVLSLASICAYDPDVIPFLNDVLGTLTARFNSVLAYQQIQKQAEQLQNQNREQEIQSKELVAQANELTEQNAELEMQKKQLDEANRLKSTFLSNMSHELRTPLNSVIALSGVLNRRLANQIPEEEYSFLEVIERNGKNLLALINDILDLSRIEAGREEIGLEQFAMQALVNEIVDIVQPQAQEKNLTLLNQISPDLPLITSDPAMCRHILQNLIANAVKFTEVGSVEISAQQVDSEIHIAVRDTGIGIASDQLPYIFDEFRQADSSASRKYGGTGLGLSIAKKYALLLKGGISVNSVPGQGSIFTLRLPRKLALSGTGALKSSSLRKDPTPQLAARGTGQRILLVEDSHPAVIQIGDILNAQGYQVQVAANGIEALAQIEAALPDAMILDLMMPEMDGFEVLKVVRDNQKTSHLPVLILTARHVTKAELNFLKGNNVHELIQKGDISKKELLAAIAQMVSPAPAAIAKPEQRAPRKPASDKPLVLVIEDNPDNMLTIRTLLCDSCTLLEAVDGQAGVEQAKAHRPDLILMDLALPVMDGYAALDAIRKDEALRHIPVVAVTASAMMGNKEEILAHGFDGYISKPIDNEVLEKTIRELLYGD